MEKKIELLNNASMLGDTSLVSRLICANVDVNGRNTNGWQPIHTAASYGHTKIVELLLNTGKVNLDGFDDNNYTPLHCAVGSMRLSTVEYLATKKPNCNLQNKFGETPLHTAFLIFRSCCKDNDNGCGWNLKNESPAIHRSLIGFPDTIARKCFGLAMAAFFVAELNADTAIKDESGETAFDKIPNDYFEKEAVKIYFNALCNKFPPISIRCNNEACNQLPKRMVDLPFTEGNTRRWIQVRDKEIKRVMSTINALKFSIFEIQSRCEEKHNVIEKLLFNVQTLQSSHLLLTSLCEQKSKLIEEMTLDKQNLNRQISELQSMLDESVKTSHLLKTRVESLEAHFVCHACRQKQIGFKLLCGHEFCDECYERFGCCSTCKSSDE